ncbi:YqaA family protein [Leptospira kmetyi]|uniref:DedA family protein n=1 Tax=Leptospira kmetyi TaxID=408139 RepID=A0ABX4N9W9_9LEPT|nr:VTT domain-containing protein [Leptospira kmetyi]EQA55735.1 SNARE-like domain protein [Leptospira kmetyi serovar Malaysia str. Bejo-Iso9]PJZ28902.1 DedA family protein [Leptospira kmetyi]TGK14971.1 DedA family protein [Leptospira kmetyi]TGK31470.1 DedA family protein [Leptospira kmetyi]
MENNIWEILSKLIPMYGGLGLAIVSFAAATILPFSSEAALGLAIVSGLPPYEAVIWASIGNCAACSFNYALGYGSRTFVHGKLDSSPMFQKLYRRMETSGWPILLLSFLPVIGDPITILSGFFRQRLWLFVIVVFTLRIARYILLAFFFVKA